MTETDALQVKCCKRRRITNMDYVHASGKRWETKTPITHRICTSCWTHWFGKSGDVKVMSRDEWNAKIADAFSAPNL
jgi:hypothetical protein